MATLVLGVGLAACSTPAPRARTFAGQIAVTTPALRAAASPEAVMAPVIETVEVTTALVPPPDPPVVPVTIAVAKDRGVLVVQGQTPTPIIYLHGRCGDPKAFLTWARQARKLGTILSMVGDKKCKDGSRTKWSDDTVGLDRRISSAILAVEKELGIELDDERRVVIGYSQGSLKAEALATRFPARYPRAALIGGPRAPRDQSLNKTEAILIMVGDHDAREHLQDATKSLKKRGKLVNYIELPNARHGEYGPLAEQTMGAALEWLVQNPAPLRS